jgi:hypothetical protein
MISRFASQILPCDTPAAAGDVGEGTSVGTWDNETATWGIFIQESRNSSWLYIQ